MGIIAICADIVTENILEILFGIFFSNKFSMFLLNNIIPIVPKYDNFTPISFIENGLIINVTNKLIDMLVKLSCFLFTNFAATPIIPIIHALITDGVKFVININAISAIIVLI